MYVLHCGVGKVWFAVEDFNNHTDFVEVYGYKKGKITMTVLTEMTKERD